MVFRDTGAGRCESVLHHAPRRDQAGHDLNITNLKIALLLNFKEAQLRWKGIANERGKAIAEGDSQPKKILTADGRGWARMKAFLIRVNPRYPRLKSSLIAVNPRWNICGKASLLASS